MTAFAIELLPDVEPMPADPQRLPPIAGGRPLTVYLGPCGCAICGWPVWYAGVRDRWGVDASALCWRERNGERHVCRRAA